MIFSFVEKVDSPIGDENDLDDEALVQDFGVEKVDSPIGDENAFAKLLLSSPFCV